MNEFLNSVFLLDMQHAIKYIKLKLNDPYPFDIENRYYKYVGVIIAIVSIVELMSISILTNVTVLNYQIFPNLPILLVVFYFLTIFISSHVIYLIVYPIAKRRFQLKKWKLYHHICLSVFLALNAATFTFLFSELFKVTVNGSNNVAYIIFIRAILSAIFTTIVTIIYDFNFFKKRELINEIEKIKKDSEIKATVLNISKKETLLNIVDVHPTLKIDVNALICCYSELNYVYFVTTQKPSDPIRIKITFKEVEEMFLPYPFFIKCNRGLLVNFNFLETIKSIDKTKVLYLKQIGKPFPISRNYYSKIDLYLTKT